MLEIALPAGSPIPEVLQLQEQQLQLPAVSPPLSFTAAAAFDFPLLPGDSLLSAEAAEAAAAENLELLGLLNSLAEEEGDLDSIQNDELLMFCEAAGKADRLPEAEPASKPPGLTKSGKRAYNKRTGANQFEIEVLDSERARAKVRARKSRLKAKFQKEGVAPTHQDYKDAMAKLAAEYKLVQASHALPAKPS